MDNDNPEPQPTTTPWANDYTRYLTGGGRSTPRSGSCSRGRSGGRSSGRSGSLGSSPSTAEGSSSHTSAVPEQHQRSFTQEAPVPLPVCLPTITPVSPPPPRPPLTADEERYCLAIKDILDSPGHDLLQLLHPHRPPGTLWYIF